MLVILRVTVGWHFLYEGVWKIAHSEEFSAQPFLTQAKGPAANLFSAMVPDLDGRQRLLIKQGESGEQGEPGEQGKQNDQGEPSVSAQVYTSAWGELRETMVETYQLDAQQQEAVDVIHERYTESAQNYLDERAPDILGYFNALDRHEQEAATNTNATPFLQKRAWDRKQELRKEVGVWLSELDDMGEQYRSALRDILTDKQRARGKFPSPELGYDQFPVVGSQSKALDLAVTYGLTAIGACLLIGLFTRLASLGGVLFLISVLLTQPPWPTIYPPAPEVTGHALVVDKNFVELVAMLVLAATAAGRWGGLDFFIHRWLGKPMRS